MAMNPQSSKSSAASILLCTMLALGAHSASGDESSPPAGSVSAADGAFVVFDATLYKHKPDLSHYGLKPIKVVCGHCFYPGKRVQPGLPSQERVETAARKAARAGHPAVLNIEFWPLTGSEEVVAESLYRFEIVASWFRAAAPEISMGFYAYPPDTRLLAGDQWPG
jgi:hypothetical protein